MLFGTKKSFAIECALNKDYGGEWLFGKFCYWINGRQVGDYDLGVSLRDVITSFEWIKLDFGKRDGGVLCQRSYEEIFELLDMSIYGSGSSDITEILVPETVARFDIRPILDVFNNCKVFLVGCGGTDLVLFKIDEDEDLGSIILESGFVDRVIRENYKYLSDLHERELLTV